MNAPPPPRSLAEVVAGLTADADPYLSCDECFDQICAYVEQVAADPAYEDAVMRRHLDTCGACAEEAATLLELGALDLTS